MAHQRILILGGGFAGVYAAKRLVRGLRKASLPDVEVGLVSRENYLTFQPLLPEVISGDISALHAISPIRRVIPGVSLYVRRIEEIDLNAQTVRLEPSYERRGLLLQYDHLVLSLGNRLATGLVPGLAEHALPFKYLGDALRLRHHLIHVLEEAAITTDPDERRRLLTFAVVGGGFSGIECMAEMEDFLSRAVRAYPAIKPQELAFVILQSAATILPEMKPALAEFAHGVLQKRGIRIDVNTRLTAVTATEAIAQNKSTGEKISVATRTVVATVPAEAHPLISSLNLLQQGGKVVVNEHLRCESHPNVWAIGDCASVPVPGEGHAPPTAQHAVRQGELCGHNIIAALTSGTPQRYEFKSLGSLASLGGRSAVAQVLGVKLSGFLAWVIWRAVYLSKIPGWDRRARVLVDWIVSLVLPRDVAQLRIFHSGQVCREHFEQGETLFLQGDLGDRVYFIVKGEADVEIEGRVVSTSKAGDAIGEIALISDAPRRATVRAKTPLDVISVNREAFDALVSHFPGVKGAMQEIMDRHLAPAANDSPISPEPSLTIKATGSAGGQS
jgi:NADH dehydrogenase